MLKNPRAFWMLLAVILLAGFGTRLMIADHGFPGLQIGDENSDLSTALRLTQGELPAAHVRYHRSLIAYADGSAVAGLLGVHVLRGDVRSLDDFQDLYFQDHDQFTLATRLMMALLTTLAIGLVGLTGRFLSDRVGLLAALALSVNGFFLLNSTFALPDGLVTFSVALFVWLLMRLWKQRRSRDYFLAGIGLALIMLSKLSAAVAGTGLIAVHCGIVWEGAAHDPKRFFRALLFHRGVLWATLGLVAGNLCFNPLAFIHPADLRHELQRLDEYAYTPYESSLQGQLKIIWVQLKEMILTAWRWMLPASILGIVAAARWKRHGPYWVIVTIFATLLIVIGRVISINYKVFYWTPWLIPMALLSAIGLDFLLRAKRRPLRVTGGLVVAALLALEGAHTLQIVRIFDRTDTRIEAQQYIERTISPGTPIMSGAPIAYSVPFQRSETSIRRALDLGSPQLEAWKWWLEQAPGQRPGLPYDVYGPEMQSVIDTYADMDRLISEDHIAYVVEADFCYGPKTPSSPSAIDFPAISDAQRDRWELVQVFSPFEEDHCTGKIDDRTGFAPAQDTGKQVRTGPIIRIYRVPGS